LAPPETEAGHLSSRFCFNIALEAKNSVMQTEQISFRAVVTDIPSTTYATHALYMYPAKFIPQVVRYVIDRYT